MITPQDRLDFLIGAGVSPGTDDSYEGQLQKFLVQKRVLQDKKEQIQDTLQGSIRDNTKRGPLNRINILLNNLREHEKPEGGPSPVEFAGQVLANTIPTPHELSPGGINEAISGVGGIISNPIAAAKALALNPPKPSVLASMLVPEAGLAVYRNTVPLAARVYLHHIAGIPTPFNRVTKYEREIISKVAQDNIDALLKKQYTLDIANKEVATNINNLRTMTSRELVTHLSNLNNDRSVLPRFRSILNNKLQETYSDGVARFTIGEILKYPELHFSKKLLERARNYAIGIYRDKLNRTTGLRNRIRATLSNTGEFGEAADNTNVRTDYLRLTGNKLNAIPMSLVDMPGRIEPRKRLDLTSAFGKTYIKPTIDEVGNIVPEALQDTYKFYPDAYMYRRGEGRQVALHRIEDAIKSFSLSSSNKEYSANRAFILNNMLKHITSMSSDGSFGIWARKLGMLRPTSIIDIPLRSSASMNAYDKAAILMGASPLARQGK